MTQYQAQIYKHPPVTEMVIEVRVEKALDGKDLDKIVKKMSTAYPHQVPMKNVDIEIRNDSEGREDIRTHAQLKGYQLVSEDQTDKTLVQLNSLSVAELSPYKGWNYIHHKFIDGWKVWKKIAGTRSINRVGIRSVNRIDIPLESQTQIDLEDYVTFNPEIPGLSDFPMTEYLIQLSQPINEFWSANITSNAIKSPLVNHISLILDIDIFRIKDIPVKDEDLWELMNEAHVLKNDVFEACITHKARELFNK